MCYTTVTNSLATQNTKTVSINSTPNTKTVSTNSFTASKSKGGVQEPSARQQEAISKASGGGATATKSKGGSTHAPSERQAAAIAETKLAPIPIAKSSPMQSSPNSGFSEESNLAASGYTPVATSLDGGTIYAQTSPNFTEGMPAQRQNYTPANLRVSDNKPFTPAQQNLISAIDRQKARQDVNDKRLSSAYETAKAFAPQVPVLREGVAIIAVSPLAIGSKGAEAVEKSYLAGRSLIAFPRTTVYETGRAGRQALVQTGRQATFRDPETGRLTSESVAGGLLIYGAPLAPAVSRVKPTRAGAALAASRDVKPVIGKPSQIRSTFEIERKTIIKPESGPGVVAEARRGVFEGGSKERPFIGKYQEAALRSGTRRTSETNIELIGLETKRTILGTKTSVVSAERIRSNLRGVARPGDGFTSQKAFVTTTTERFLVPRTSFYGNIERAGTKASKFVEKVFSEPPVSSKTSVSVISGKAFSTGPGKTLVSSRAVEKAVQSETGSVKRIQTNARERFLAEYSGGTRVLSGRARTTVVGDRYSPKRDLYSAEVPRSVEAVVSERRSPYRPQRASITYDKQKVVLKEREVTAGGLSEKVLAKEISARDQVYKSVEKTVRRPSRITETRIAQRIAPASSVRPSFFPPGQRTVQSTMTAPPRRLTAPSQITIPSQIVTPERKAIPRQIAAQSYALDNRFRNPPPNVPQSSPPPVSTVPRGEPLGGFGLGLPGGGAGGRGRRSSGKQAFQKKKYERSLTARFLGLSKAKAPRASRRFTGSEIRA